MKLVVAGSRHFDLEADSIDNYVYLLGIPFRGGPDEVVSGGCPTGADKAAKRYAEIYSYAYKEFPADWDKYGKMAGPIRNGQMAAYGDALLLIWDGASRGSANMKAKMVAMKKPIYEVIIKRTQ